MSEERDDRTRVSLAERKAEEAARLEVWATAVGRSFTWDRKSQAAVGAIVCDTIRRYELFKSSVRDAEGFIARRITDAANDYRKVRGLEPLSAPASVVPHLSDVVRTRAALAMLPSGARRALQILFENEDASFRDVAKELDVSVRYAKYLVEKAVTLLEEWLARAWPRE